MAEPKKASKLKIRQPKPSNLTSRFFTGAMGGITINGLIDISLYVDRVDIPDTSELIINQDRGVASSDPSNRDVIFREVHTALLCDLNTAKAFHDWLGHHVQLLEKLINLNGTDTAS